MRCISIGCTRPPIPVGFYREIDVTRAHSSGCSWPLYLKKMKSLAKILGYITTEIGAQILAILLILIAIYTCYESNIYIWLPLASCLVLIPGILYVIKSFKNKSFIQLFIGVGAISIFTILVYIKV